MGCDIHATLEKKRYWPGLVNMRADDNAQYTYSWVSAGYPWEEGSSRNYAMFSVLGDCGRNPQGQRSISGRRGFPVYRYTSSDPDEAYSDLSDEFKAYYEDWKENAHSPGYATLRELQAYDLTDNGMPQQWADRVGPAMHALLRRMERVAEEYDGDPDAVRIVFFFDN